ncbi:hypothetical protein VP01_869g9 [Puccinia sorghi]|uniref:Uncharacterized protein n=1 Tax=Puccinia sorghi TaxID=27349 RepID=A0A0L6U8Q2_9BASI|nr:hypothetical protein VP01_869g9 [Puccinia sorghi]
MGEIVKGDGGRTAEEDAPSQQYILKGINTTPTSYQQHHHQPIMIPLPLILLWLARVNCYQCPEENKEEVDEHGFFHQGLHVGWDAHHIGWAAAGVMASIATLASLTNIYLHCKNYNKPLEQRQIEEKSIDEGCVLASFLILCLLYVGRSPLEQHEVMRQKEKTPLVFPFCCFRYRPSKPYFLIATKWSVLQYVILRPLISATALITDTQKVFCASTYSPHFANLWLTIIIFISTTIALYGLLITKHLAQEDLKGHRPTCKFMSIKDTEYWSKTNIADGVNALATTIEMAIVALFQLYAFSYTEYRAVIKGSEVNRQKSAWKNFLHSQDYRDFGRDIVMGIRFFIDRLRGEAYTKSRHATPQGTNGLDFQAAFGLDPGHTRIRDPEWKVSHARSSHAGRQKGWATLSDGPEDEVWDAKAFGHDKVLDHPADDPVYESIKLGHVDSQQCPASDPAVRRLPPPESYGQSPPPFDHIQATDLDSLVASIYTRKEDEQWRAKYRKLKNS